MKGIEPADDLSIDERLNEISALFEFGRSLTTEEEREVQEVRDRWVRLKERYVEEQGKP